MWATFCDLAMPGGPPHNGQLLSYFNLRAELPQTIVTSKLTIEAFWKSPCNRHESRVSEQIPSRPLQEAISTGVHAIQDVSGFRYWTGSYIRGGFGLVRISSLPLTTEYRVASIK